MSKITIQGNEFEAPDRYTEGHELTEGEASALNQTYHENLRNNFAKKVKDALEANAFDMAAFQAQFSEYADTYAFGVRTPGVGGVSRDPVMSEAVSLAKTKIRELLKKAGKKADQSAITEAAKALLASDRGAPIMEMAKKRVAEAQAIAGDQLGDFISSIPEKAPTAPAPQA